MASLTAIARHREEIPCIERVMYCSKERRRKRERGRKREGTGESEEKKGQDRLGLA